MQAIARTSPYLRKKTSTKRMMIDVLVALIPVIGWAVYKFKFDFISKAIVASLIAIAVEIIGFAMMKDKNDEQ